MLRIHEIRVKKEKDSKFPLSKVQTIMEEKLVEVASAKRFVIKQENDEELLVTLETPISLQTANKILNAFYNARIRIMKLNWERKILITLIRGYLEITIS